MKHIADALEAIGQPITEYDLCNQILNGLGQEYDPVHTSVVNRDTPINFEDLFGQLLTFEMRMDSHTTTPTLEQPSTAFFTNRSTHSRAQGRGGSRGSSYFRGRGRGRNHGGRANPSNNHSTKPSNAPSCQICNRVGHSALDCFHRLDLSFQGRQPPPKLQAMAAMRQDSTWFTDTGATNHVTADLNNLSLHSDYEGSDNLTVGNGKGLHIEHIGSTSYSSNGSTFHMQDILHVPCITKNLLSVSQFSKDNDCHFVFTSSGFSVKDNKSGKILFQGRSSKGLYPLHFQPHDKNKPYSSPSAFTSSTVSSSVWHHRLGHPSHQTLQQVAPHIHLGRSSQHQTICSSCQMGKSSRLPFQLSDSISQYPLELVHTDVWGPSSITSINGAKFYVTFIDDFSRYCWIFPLAFKSQVYDVFVRFKSLVETMFDRKIKSLQTDGGGEYMSTRFRDFLANYGISHRISCPYTPEQNGRAERKHHHIVETSLTLMAHSRVPLSYWDDAFATTVFLINRMPTRILHNISPYEKLFQKSPDYTILRSFGCTCYPYLRPYSHGKMSYRTMPCVFLGYGRNHKAYKCLDPISQRVYLSRHVIFDEATFPYAHVDKAYASSPSVGLDPTQVATPPTDTYSLLQLPNQSERPTSGPPITPMTINPIYGPIVDIDLKIPPRPPGYAFVEFEEARDADGAIRGRDGYSFDGHRLRVELAHGGRGQSSSTDRRSSYNGGGGGSGGRGGVSKRSDYRVVITGLPSSASWQDLKDHMRRAGDVCFSQVFRAGGGTTGIVDYTNYDDMKYAIRKLDDSEFRNAFSRASRSRSKSPLPSPPRRKRVSKSPKKRIPSKSRSRSLSRSHSPAVRSDRSQSVDSRGR
ncbi:hypothetical protein HHK36_020800 [Tetracentron sinense]|uniref:Uncharacterized protein n=1 Tax=Tetracentron sinense TaxID=13715 RepID=A0A834YXP8_TETSI|nr:hypothetical protein HHK36_020800 [Tetracentron sinense]